MNSRCRSRTDLRPKPVCYHVGMTTYDNDPFQGRGELFRPAEHAAAVTPSDTVLLDPACRGLYVGGGGNVAVLLVGEDTAVTFTGVQGGTVLPLRAARVDAAGTTATGLVALW